MPVDEAGLGPTERVAGAPGRAARPKKRACGRVRGRAAGPGALGGSARVARKAITGVGRRGAPKAEAKG